MDVNRRRLSLQEQYDVIRDIKSGMKRSEAMIKYGIRHHSTLSEIFKRHGHKVKAATYSNNNHSPATGSPAASPVVLRTYERRRSHPPNQLITLPLNGQTPQPPPPLTLQINQRQLQPVSAGQLPVQRIIPTRPNTVPRRTAFRRSRPSASPASGNIPIEQKIDTALTRLSKLNQKLIYRDGRKVICRCCEREVNFKDNTIVARLCEHCMTKGHNERIMEWSQKSKLPVSESNSDSNSDSCQTPITQQLEVKKEQLQQQQQTPTNGCTTRTPIITSRVVPAAVSSDPPRLRIKFKNPVTITPCSAPKITVRTPRIIQKPVSASPAAAVVPETACNGRPMTPDRIRQFHSDLLQTFLEVDIPVHKLNMYPLRNFLKKYTGLPVPKFEESSLSNGQF